MTDALVWIDCEMTGLDLRRDALIEVAVLVTDADLNLVDDGLDIVIHAGDDLLDAMVPVVHDMHAASGLTELVRASTVTLAEAEKASSNTSPRTSRRPAPLRCAETRSRPTAASSPATCRPSMSICTTG